MEPEHDFALALSRASSKVSTVPQIATMHGESSSVEDDQTAFTLDSADNDDKADGNVVYSLSRLVDIGRHIRDMTMAHLQRPGACRGVIDTILHLQSQWRPDWPYKEYCAKVLMAFSNVTRLVEHIESDTRTYNPNGAADGPQKTFNFWRIHIDSPTFPIKAHHFGHQTSVSPHHPPLPSTAAQTPAQLRSVQESSPAPPMLSAQGPTTKEGVNDTHRTAVAKPRASHRQRLPTDLYATSGEKQAINILMEWTLEGIIQYISPACEQVLGYAFTFSHSLGERLYSRHYSGTWLIDEIIQVHAGESYWH
jgi:hypothetical protein